MYHNIIICEPNKKSIETANTHLKEYLFRDDVNYIRAKQQHDHLVDTLKMFEIHVISLNELLPKDLSTQEMANLLFTRDTFIHTPKGIVIGRMKEKVRQIECEVMEHIFRRLNQQILYKMEAPETLEGGDYVYKNGITFIAIGTRTNLMGAYKLMHYDILGSYKVALVECEQPDTDMHRIHLDCYCAPFGDNYCLLWKELLNINTAYQRIVKEYILQEDGTYAPSGIKESLFSYLIKNNFNVIPISTRSHYNYGCNILELHNGVVLVQDEESHKKIKNSIMIPFDEIHHMYGGIHCATNTL
uniref:Amidinotransferase n=1 Tax=viral metagenome TaxID=1070528 RepID=A0A6C0CSC5_9ZZZZ